MSDPIISDPVDEDVRRAIEEYARGGMDEAALLRHLRDARSPSHRPLDRPAPATPSTLRAEAVARRIRRLA